MHEFTYFDIMYFYVVVLEQRLAHTRLYVFLANRRQHNITARKGEKKLDEKGELEIIKRKAG